MSYCDPDDVIKAVNPDLLAQLTASSGASADEETIQDSADDISNLMDSYLLGRYATPITGPDAVLRALKAHCIRLVIAQLFQDRLMLESYASVKADADLATEWLKGIQSGKLSLPGAAAAATAEPTSASTSFGSYTRVFGPNDDGTLTVL